MDTNSRVGRISFLPVLGVGLVAFAITTALFFSFDEPFALRGDNKLVHFPMKLDAWRQWTTGHIPFWSNGLWLGFPLLGDATTGAFYLPHALAFLVTPSPHLRAFDLAVAMHAGLLAAGSFGLLQRLGCGALASGFGALGVLLASHVLGWTAYLPGFSSLAWWPWVLVGADRVGRAPADSALRAIVLASIPIAAQVLAGYPEMALYSGCIAAVWIVLTPAGAPLGHRLLRTAALAGASALLAGPQLVPGMYALLDSTRSAASEMRSLLSLQGSLGDVFDPTVAARQLAVLSPFLGGATLLLAATALFRRAPRSFVLAATALVAAAASLGDRTPVYGLISEIPFFEFFRGPHKFYLITQLMVIWLAALGVEGLLRNGRKASAVAAVLGLVAVGEHATSLALHLPRVSSGHTKSEIEVSQAVELLGAVAPLLTTASSDTGPPPRVFTGSYVTTLGSLPMLVGVETVRGAGVALLSPRHDWMRTSHIGPEHLDLLGAELLFLQGRCDRSRFDDPILQRGERFCVRRNEDARPRYELLSRARRGDVESMIAEMRLRRPPTTIAIDAPADIELPDSGDAPGDITVVSYRPGEVEFRVRAAGERMLLVRESWSLGWEAFVDDERVGVYPAAALFFAVPVPPGSHAVRLHFSAPGTTAGLTLGALWLGVAALTLRRP
ncbi:MAG: hypothetical protein VCC20_02685 [Myxococcota bacterium]